MDKQKVERKTKIRSYAQCLKNKYRELKVSKENEDIANGKGHRTK